MTEIRRSPLEVGSLSHYLQGFVRPRWSLGISSINSVCWCYGYNYSMSWKVSFCLKQGIEGQRSQRCCCWVLSVQCAELLIIPCDMWPPLESLGASKWRGKSVAVQRWGLVWCNSTVVQHEMLLPTIFFSPLAQVLESWNPGFSFARHLGRQHKLSMFVWSVIYSMLFKSGRGAPCQELARRMAAATECSRLGAFCNSPWLALGTHRSTSDRHRRSKLSALAVACWVNHDIMNIATMIPIPILQPWWVYCKYESILSVGHFAVPVPWNNWERRPTFHRHFPKACSWLSPPQQDCMQQLLGFLNFFQWSRLEAQTAAGRSRLT